jgi:hypothetical protein
MLHGGAHAAEQGAAAAPSLGEGQKQPAAVKQQVSASKKAKAGRKNTEQSLSAVTDQPKAEAKQGNATETPPEATGQTLQLRGVRG